MLLLLVLRWCFSFKVSKKASNADPLGQVHDNI